jgi:F-type H+-transporting ATPase subunit b
VLDLQVSTILFQTLNFLILLGVLTRFFYRPVLRVMKEREEAIAARLRAAEERGRQAEAQRQHLAILERDAREKADQILASARADGQRAGAHIVDEARREAARLLDEARRTVDEEGQAALARVETHVRDTAVQLAASLIRQAAGPMVHEGLIEQFLNAGVGSTSAELETVRRELSERQTGITIELAYAVSAETEARLRALMARDLGLRDAAGDVAIRVAPELVGGLRILGGNVVLDFSLRQTLLALKEPRAETVDQEPC